MIDTHVHFWELSRGYYDWITKERLTLCRDFTPGDFVDVIENTDVESCLAVQAAPMEAETDLLLSYAKKFSYIKGVIGWTDLSSRSLSTSLDYFKDHSAVKGIRPMAGVHSGPEWLGSDYDAGIEALSKNNLILEALALPKHLSAITSIAQKYPSLVIVINHASKPAPNDWAYWSKIILEFSNLENVFCKLSGLTAQSLDIGHYQVIFDTLLDVFGPSRLIWGSDYPVLLETSEYVSWLKVTQYLLERLTFNEKRQITTITAKQVYKL